MHTACRSQKKYCFSAQFWPGGPVCRRLAFYLFQQSKEGSFPSRQSVMSPEPSAKFHNATARNFRKKNVYCAHYEFGGCDGIRP